MALKNNSRLQWILAIISLVILLFAIEGILAHFHIHQNIPHKPYSCEYED